MTRKPKKAQSAPTREKVACTFHMPFEMYRRMSIIKIDRATSLQRLLEEAVGEWLAKQGGRGE